MFYSACVNYFLCACTCDCCVCKVYGFLAHSNVRPLCDVDISTCVFIECERIPLPFFVFEFVLIYQRPFCAQF